MPGPAPPASAPEEPHTAYSRTFTGKEKQKAELRFSASFGRPTPERPPETRTPPPETRTPHRDPLPADPDEETSRSTKKLLLGLLIGIAVLLCTGILYLLLHP